MANNLEDIIEKIKIAELDPDKTYFLQISSIDLYRDIRTFADKYKFLTEKFEEYGIKNIIFLSHPDVEIKFTEIGDNND